MKRHLLLACCAPLLSAALAQTTMTYNVSNPSSADRTDVPVVISLDKSWGEVATALVTCSGDEIPCQLDDLDQDGIFDELCFLVNLKAKARH